MVRSSIAYGYLAFPYFLLNLTLLDKIVRLYRFPAKEFQKWQNSTSNKQLVTYNKW